MCGSLWCVFGVGKGLIVYCWDVGEFEVVGGDFFGEEWLCWIFVECDGMNGCDGEIFGVGEVMFEVFEVWVR